MSKRALPKIKPIRAGVRESKESTLTRTACAQVVGMNGPQCELWKATPAIQTAGQSLVAAGIKLEEAESQIRVLEGLLETAKNHRAAVIVEFDAAHGVYIANVESYAKTVEDVTGLGVPVARQTTHGLAAPSSIATKFIVLKQQIQIRVRRASGRLPCFVEISPDPVAPGTWQRLPGVGSFHKLKGFSPGTYWVRAAVARASEVSEYTAPVSVIVT